MNPHAQLGSRSVNLRTENTQHWEAVMPADRPAASPHLCVSRWDQGEPECFLGRRRVPTSLPESGGNVAAMR
jgi:hypothetical protein